MQVAGREQKGRGCLYFNFGTERVLQLLVSIHTLRKHYKGPITVFLQPDKFSDRLSRDLEGLDVSIEYHERMSRSFDRHKVFLNSPYATTLSLDSDIVFFGPIDELWEPLEKEGVLVTRFYHPPFGIDGTPEAPTSDSRVALLDMMRPLIGDAAHDLTLNRFVHDRIDINIGVFGISRPKGDAFLAEFAQNMEDGRDLSVPLFDEMLVNALVGKYPHFLADEKWNCPADEFFRCTNLADAIAIHYFGDGSKVFDVHSPMGRNIRTWAGKKWYAAYFELARTMDVSLWRKLDRNFDRRAEPPFAHGPGLTLRYWAKDVENALRRVRDILLRRPRKRGAHEPGDRG